MKVGNQPIYVALIMLLIWIGLIYQPNLSWTLFLQEFLAGLIVAIGVSILTYRNFSGKGLAYLHPRRVAYAIAFFFTFLIEMIKANLNMARIVLSPRLPVKPGIVEVETSLEQPSAKLFMGNAITLTPGTLTIDIIDNKAYIHWVEVKSEDAKEAGEMIKGKFERLLKGVYS